MIRSFLLGTIMGGAAVWLFRDELQAYLDARTRGVRARAASGLHTVEKTADELLDRAARPLRRGEEMLEHAREKIAENLRAGQERIAPEPPTDPPS